MAQISTADFKNGITLDLTTGSFQIVDFQHVKPGKGGAFVRTTLKNVRTGAVLDRTFRAGEKMERAFVDKRDMQFLYNDGADYVFMDTRPTSSSRCRRRRSATPRTTCSRTWSAAVHDVRRRDHRRRAPGVGRAADRARPSPACRATGCRAPASRPRS